MTVHAILKMGDPRLLQQARPVTEFDTPALHQLIADMQDTMAAAQGAGLAAPQIGVDLQVVIFGTDAPGNAALSIIEVSVTGCAAYEGFASDAGAFIGFYSSSASITSLSITVASPLPGASVFASIDNLYLAVPSPGAAALVALAGLLAKRRRV